MDRNPYAKTLTPFVLACALVGFAPLSADAQGRNRNGIPPGHMPPAGLCRVWYDNLPPGRQPRPTDCASARAIASRSRDARVIYSDSRDNRRDDDWYRDGDWRQNDRSRDYPRNGRYSTNDVAFNQGFQDGLEKGRDDGDDNDRFDPARHGRYRSADHGYRNEYGSKERYRDVYRQGFQQGYSEGYRQERGYIGQDGQDRTARRRWP